jgi:hypothetical protein
MADRKISELTNITGANLADGDELVVVDTSASETKAITFGEFKNALDTATGFVSITGDTMTGDLALSGADITFGDNDKAIFGAGSDLSIYHDGTRSYIDENGTGDLWFRAENMFLRNMSNKNYLKGTSNAQVELFHNGLIKLATTSTGVDITGTLTSDGLTVQTTNGLNAVIEGTTSYQYLQFKNSGETENYLGFVNDDFTVTAGNTKYLQVEGTGDISFYEDTGTTAKFFWDASAESLGIGTSSPSGSLHLLTPAGSSGNENTKIPLVVQENSFSSANLFELRNSVGGALSAFDQSGNLGIGTSSPSSPLNVVQSADTDLNGLNGIRVDAVGATNNRYLGLGIYDTQGVVLTAGSSDTSSSTIAFRTASSGAEAERMRIDSSGNIQGSKFVSYRDASSAYLDFVDAGTASDANGDVILSGYYPIIFKTDINQERMRIDRSGNLLVGMSSYSSSSAGTTMQSGLLTSARSGNIAAYFNRLSSDGSIVSFAKDGSTVGSIGSYTSLPYIGKSDVTLLFDPSGPHMIPRGTNGGARDAAINLGASTNRFKDLYLSGDVDTSGVFKGTNGTASVPTHSFLNDPDNGMFRPTTNTVGFSTAGSEAMRIDSSGNLYVGTTDNTIYNDAANEYGFVVEPSGEMQLSADNRPLMYLNRQNGDGNIIDFRKDGTTVGSIGTAGGRVYFADDSTNGITFSNSSAIMWPSNSSGGVVDNTMDIGSSSFRFKDLYLSGGVYLGGTGSANHLDDYEEGTWTPSSFSNWTVSPTFTSATYTKIGRQVTLFINFSTGTTGNQAHFLGAPFSGNGTGAGVNGSISDMGHSLVSGTTVWFTKDNDSLSGTRFTVTYIV